MLIAFRTDFADFALDMGIIGREVFAVRPLGPAVHQRAAARAAGRRRRRLRRRPLGRSVRRHPRRQPILAVLPTATRAQRRGAERHLGLRQDHPGAQLPPGAEQPHPGLDPDRHRHLGDRAAGAVRDQRGGVRSRRRACWTRPSAELPAGGAAFPFSLPAGFSRVQHPGDVRCSSTGRFGPGWRSTGRTGSGVLTALARVLHRSGRADWSGACTWTTAPGPGDLANPLLAGPAAGRELRPSFASGPARSSR